MYSGEPRISYNTIGFNGSHGLYVRSNGNQSILEHNIVTRNAQGIAGDGRSSQRGYNNVWRNGNDYTWSAGVTASDISSDPQYVSPYGGGLQLEDNSPSKTASSEGGEIGAYGNGGNPPDSGGTGLSTTPTLAGDLTRSESWSGEIELTDSVNVPWPYKLVIETGTKIKVPANKSLEVNGLARIVGTEAQPITIEASDGQGNGTVCG